MLIAGCGSSGGDAAPAATPYAGPVGEGEGTLNVLAWPGYAEDGSTDPAVDWVTPFEEATGCQVNVKTGNSSDEMVQLMQSGEYDGVSASGDATQRLIAGGEVSPVNTDLIPNYADVYEDLKLDDLVIRSSSHTPFFGVYLASHAIADALSPPAAIRSTTDECTPVWSLRSACFWTSRPHFALRSSVSCAAASMVWANSLGSWYAATASMASVSI